jgi:hypothetical protein
LNGQGNDRKRAAIDEIAHDSTDTTFDAAQKRQRNDECKPDFVSSTDAIHPPAVHAGSSHQVQKFRYVKGTGPNHDYRELLATFAHVTAAAEDDPSLMKKIEAACNSGGDYVNSYYYQYEVSLENVTVFEYHSCSLFPHAFLALCTARSLGSGGVSKPGTISQSGHDAYINGVPDVPPEDNASALVPSIKSRNGAAASVKHTQPQEGQQGESYVGRKGRRKKLSGADSWRFYPHAASFFVSGLCGWGRNCRSLFVS